MVKTDVCNARFLSKETEREQDYRHGQEVPKARRSLSVQVNRAFFLVDVAHRLTSGLFVAKVLIIILSVITNSLTIECVPLAASSVKVPNRTFESAIDFLIRFGYLPKNDPNSGALRSENNLKEAIIQMQKFGNISQTGVLDNETLSVMKRKRCGVADVFQSSPGRSRRYTLQGAKWPNTDLTWSVKYWAINIDHHYVLREFKKAFKIWSDASKLTFTETRRADADIVISFLTGQHGDEYPFDGPGSILAHAFFPGSGIGGDAHFDGDEQWAKSENNFINQDDYDQWDGVNLFAVAAHEFGHSLGLSHSTVPGSLMFPYYQVIKDDYQLPYDDAMGIQKLYGAKSPNSHHPMPSPPNFSNIPKYPVSKFPAGILPNNNRSSPTASIPTAPHPKDIPNACNTSIDAIAAIRRDIFIFKGKYFWWLKENRTLTRFDPIEIHLYFIDLPLSITKVDAVYERPSDKKIIFFIGKEYWLFNNNRAEPGYPRPLTSLGLSEEVERIDAAMVWSHNSKTYFFSGKNYWRFDEEEQKVELDYPRDTSVWRGVPFDIDASFQWKKNGKTYFFKEKLFWVFDDRKMNVTSDSPRSLSKFWFEMICKNVYEDDFINKEAIEANMSIRISFEINCTLILIYLTLQRII